MIGLGRRSVLEGIGLGLAGAAMEATPSLAADRPPSTFDLAKPSDRLKAYMMMRGSLDDRLVVGCMSGRYFGVVDDEITPLWDVSSATFSRFRRRSDGGYDGVTAEVAYFIDPVTRRAPGRFLNPYLGIMVDEPQQGFLPSKIVLGPDLRFRLDKDVPGLTMNVEYKAAEPRGDDLWLSELTRTAFTPPGAAKPMRYSENIIMHARRSELEEPGAVRVRTDLAFTNFVSWRPWMKMGDRPGHMSAVGTGVISDGMDALSPEWLEATREKRPSVLNNPDELIAPLWKAL